VVPIPYTYPPAAPTLSGDVESINRFLQSPTLIARRLRTILQQRFIGDVVLSNRTAAQGGAIIYEGNESIYTDRAVEAVSPGGEYPVTTITSGSAQIAKTVKWGQDAFVTDEAVAHLLMSPVERALQKLANTLIKQVDSVCLALIAAAVTQTQAAAAAWSTSPATLLLDIQLAKSKILGQNQGYSPDLVLVDDTNYAYVSANPAIVGAARREDGSNPVYTGEFPIIAGLQVLPTPNLPGGSGAWVVDSTMLGGVANDALGGGYAQAGNGVETKSMRDDDNDQFRLRARRVFVPWVQEPNAACKITGI
jgi:hypothetical protein